jgi:DNA-binding NtrC family response regulator
MTILYPEAFPPVSLPRLKAMGFVGRAFSDGLIPPLRADSAQAVCVISTKATLAPDWPRWRILLPRANRFYIAEVGEAGTVEVVEAMRDGAYDVISGADTDERWHDAIHQVVDSQALWLQLYSGSLSTGGSQLLGRSQKLKELRDTVERLGPTDVTAMLLGESGVGKERVAVALHEAGRGGPFVTLNCAAMPKDLLEAELFGAEKGAFTGAHRTRAGLVEQANGGTLFLDEVGEMDISLQPKLLRFLETRHARRVGGEKEYAVRLRVVSATNRDPMVEIKAGRFRADLYYRLAEVVIQIAPLRERSEDIPELAQAFVQVANERFGKNVERLEPGLVARLKQYSWPGNVRELKSVIDRLVLFHDGPILREGWWEPPVMLQREPEHPAEEPNPMPTHSGTAEVIFPGRGGRIALAKKLLVDGSLSLSDIAARTGVHPTTLFRWRKAGKV